MSSQTISTLQMPSRKTTYNMSNRNDTALRGSSSVKFSQSALLARSSLDRFGAYKQCSIRYIQSTDDSRTAVAEEQQYFWSWRFMGYGFHWSRRRETIIPSLSVYPVVPDLSDLLSSKLENASVLEFQMLLSSGSLHPFTRDQHGRSLLHVSLLNSFYQFSTDEL